MRSQLAIACLLALGPIACGSDNSNTSSSTSTSSSGGSSSGGACHTLCTDAKFTGGDEKKFDKVTECWCNGAGTGVAKPACETYCGPLGVGPAKSFLSMDKTKDDKCVCDGT